LVHGMRLSAVWWATSTWRSPPSWSRGALACILAPAKDRCCALVFAFFVALARAVNLTRFHTGTPSCCFGRPLVRDSRSGEQAGIGCGTRHRGFIVRWPIFNARQSPRRRIEKVDPSYKPIVPTTVLHSSMLVGFQQRLWFEMLDEIADSKLVRSNRRRISIAGVRAHLRSESSGSPKAPSSSRDFCR